MFSIHQLESLLSGLATNEAESLIRTSSLIQHISYRDGQAKTAFRKLGAISKLVTLLDNPCPEVQRAAMKAIKNIIYTNDGAKMDMRRCGGLESVVRLVEREQNKGFNRGLKDSSNNNGSAPARSQLGGIVDTIIV